MPDLTPQPGNAVAQAPSSSVSPSQIASPFMMLAKNLDDIGQGFEKFAETDATKQGFKAVTSDSEGNLQVEKSPITGPASQNYARAMKMAALAEGEGAAKRTDIALRQQYRDDPQGYLVAADAFKTKLQTDYSKATPEVGLAIGRAVDATTTMTYRGLLNEKERLDLARANQALGARIDSARDDAMALARGGDTSSDAFKSAFQTVQSLTNERVSNPRMAYPKEQADYDLQQFQGQLGAAGAIHHVDEIYKDKGANPDGSARGGYAPAMAEAEKILTDPSLKLTEAQRYSYHSKAIADIRANEAIRKQDVVEANAATQALMTQSALGMPVEPDQVNQVAQAHIAAGNPGGAARVYAAFARKPLNDDFGKQPLGDQLKQLNDLQGNARQSAAFNYLVSRGRTPLEAAGIVGGLRGETANLNPTEIHDGGIGIGISGWNGDRKAALAQFAKANNASPTDLKTQLDFVDYELKSNEAGAGAALRNAKTPEEAGQAMLGYFRPKDFDVPGAHPERAQYARQAFDAFGPNGSGKVAYSTGANPASTLWLTANRAHTVDKTAQTAWTGILKDYNEKGIVPPTSVMTDVINAARAVNDHPLLEGIAATMERIDQVNQSTQKSLPQQQADITTLIAAGRTGELAPGQQGVLGDLQRRNTAITHGLKEDPVATTVANFPEKFAAPMPLNVTDPKQLAAGLQQRAQIVQSAQQNWQTKPLSALDTADLNVVKGVVEGPDLAAKTQMFSALSQLPEDVRNATLAKLVEKGGPEMAVAAAAGSIARQAPDIAQSILRGQGALKTDKEYWPTGKTKAQPAIDALAKALPAETFSLAARTDPTGALSTAQGMVKARYADLSAQANDVSGDLKQTRLDQAVTDVTGGVLHHNGAPLISPSRGMAQPDFDRILFGVNDSDLAGVTTLNGAPVTSNYLRGSAQLESIGQGRYYVRLGKDPMRPAYAFQNANTEVPEPFVLDLRGRKPGPDRFSLSDMTQGIQP